MSIILEALKKARRDRREESDLRDEALFRQPNYDNGQRQRRGKNDYGRMLLFGCFAGIFIILIAVAIGGYFLYKGGYFSSPASDRESAKQHIATPTPELTGELDNIKKVASPEPTSAPSPIPTPTPEIKKKAPDKTATPIQPSPTPTPKPTPTPRLTTSPPTPTPNLSPKAVTPAPPRSEFQRPEDYGLKFDGVMWDDKNPAALINGQIVGIGQTIDEWVVRKISKEYIEIEKDSVKYKFKY